jgi:CheY-like chemotaxis protein
LGQKSKLRQVPGQLKGHEDGALVVVVEDDPLSAEVVMAMIRRLGYRCVHADTGRGAMELICGHDWQLHVENEENEENDEGPAGWQQKPDDTSKLRGVQFDGMSGELCAQGEGVLSADVNQLISQSNDASTSVRSGTVVGGEGRLWEEVQTLYLSCPHSCIISLVILFLIARKSSLQNYCLCRCN